MSDVSSSSVIRLESSVAVGRLFSLLLGGRFQDGLDISLVIADQTRRVVLARFLRGLSDDVSSRFSDGMSRTDVCVYFFHLSALEPDFMLSVCSSLLSDSDPDSDDFSFWAGIFSRLRYFFDWDSDVFLRLSSLLSGRGFSLDCGSASDSDIDLLVECGQWVFLYSYGFDGSVREDLVSRSLFYFDRALSFRSDDAMILTLYGIIEKKRGNMVRGWSLYENRHRIPGRFFSKPLWDGTNFSGKRLLLRHEGGFGDAIQFSRYFPEIYALSQPGGGVIFSVKAPLARLFRECFDLGGIEVHVGAVPVGLYDYVLPLFSIFHTLDPTLLRMGMDRAYISAPARRIDDGGGHKRIGLVWASTAGTSAAKSIPLDCLVRLGGVRGVHFYSLQYERDLNDSVRSRSDLSFIDMSLQPESMDFYDLACAISGLDGVISVDTAAAHLAGSMLCPLLVLVPHHDRCWRWNDGTYGHDWYPSAVRMCQGFGDDWGIVLDGVADRLNGGSFP